VKVPRGLKIFLTFTPTEAETLNWDRSRFTSNLGRDRQSRTTNMTALTALVSIIIEKGPLLYTMKRRVCHVAARLTNAALPQIDPGHDAARLTTPTKAVLRRVGPGAALLQATSLTARVGAVPVTVSALGHVRLGAAPCPGAVTGHVLLAEAPPAGPRSVRRRDLGPLKNHTKTCKLRLNLSPWYRMLRPIAGITAKVMSLQFPFSETPLGYRSHTSSTIKSQRRICRRMARPLATASTQMLGVSRAPSWEAVSIPSSWSSILPSTTRMSKETAP
jgi:hypothetical protein